MVAGAGSNRRPWGYEDYLSRCIQRFQSKNRHFRRKNSRLSRTQRPRAHIAHRRLQQVYNRIFSLPPVLSCETDSGTVSSISRRKLDLISLSFGFNRIRTFVPDCVSLFLAQTLSPARTLAPMRWLKSGSASICGQWISRTSKWPGA
jgi:hypothetical protein